LHCLSYQDKNLERFYSAILVVVSEFEHVVVEIFGGGFTLDCSKRYTIEFSYVQLGHAHRIVVEISQMRQDFAKALKSFLCSPNCVRFDPVQLVEVSEAKYKVCKLSLTRHRFTEQAKSIEIFS